MATRALRKGSSLAHVRSIGKSLPDVAEGSSSWGISLKVKGRLLTCEAIHKSAEPDSIMVRIGFARRAELLAQNPDTYYLTDHYTAYPAILVRLSRINRASLRELLTESWEFVREQVR